MTSKTTNTTTSGINPPSTTSMSSTRPYLIRAFYEWIVDNNFTPHIVVNADFPGVAVPTEYVENGQIILNISMNAVQGLTLGNQNILFQARFGGKIFNVLAPVGAVLAIYARENGRGMIFAEDTDLTTTGSAGELETSGFSYSKQEDAPLPSLISDKNTQNTTNKLVSVPKGISKLKETTSFKTVTKPHKKDSKEDTTDNKDDGNGSGKGGKSGARGKPRLTIVK